MKGGTGTIISQRKTSLQRHSNETQIDVRLNLDGNGEARVITGFGMLDHMLELMAFWGNLDLEIQCNGDIHIDAHHTVEDCGLVFGSCILEALGDKRGIARSAFARVPMDEALAEVTVDLSGRPWLAWRGDELLPPVIAHEEKMFGGNFTRPSPAAPAAICISTFYMARMAITCWNPQPRALDWHLKSRRDRRWQNQKHQGSSR